MTGGAGFIGSWVADKFLENGAEVRVIDNLTSGVSSNVPDRADLIELDIRDKNGLEGVIQDFKPDVISHHAAQIDVRKSVDDPCYDSEVNIIGTLNLLQLSLAYSLKKFLFASTGGAIYGEPNDLPANEHTAPMPISPYGVSKYSIEKYLEYYNAVHGLDYVALRYANVYGPRQNPHGEAGVVAIFCNKILNGEDCKIFGDGEQTRDYVFVEDVADANLKALDAPRGSYNIGTAVETSVNELVRLLQVASKTDVGVEYAEARHGEVERISLDISLANQVLDWAPRTPIDEGILKTWQWFKETQS